MRLNLETGYALQSLIYLAEQHGYVTSGELMSVVGFGSHEHAQKILRKLRNGDMISVKRGVAGGYILKKDPNEIKLWDVLNVMEDSMCMQMCLQENGECARGIKATCRLRKFFLKAQDEMEDRFTHTTLQDILNGEF